MDEEANQERWLWGLGTLVVLLFATMMGFTIGWLAKPTETIELPVVTEKIQMIEIPVITEKIVEIQSPMDRWFDINNPVLKWIDPDTQAVIYIYPDGYTGEVFPLYTLVPPEWYTQLLHIILELNGGVMPQEVLQSIPKDWVDSVAPNNGFFEP